MEVWLLVPNGLTLCNILADNVIKSVSPKPWFCFSEFVSLILQHTRGERKTRWKVTLTFKATGVSFGTFLPWWLLPSECLRSYLQPSLWSPWGLITSLTSKPEDL